MSVEVHLDWEGTTHQVGVVHSAARGSAVTFEYTTEWLARPGAFAIDPTSLPLRPGPHHATTQGHCQSLACYCLRFWTG